MATQRTQELFAHHPNVQSEAFGNKPPQDVGMKLGAIFSEIIRLLELESPMDLGAAVAELALKHIEYGLQESHVDPFKVVLIQSLR